MTQISAIIAEIASCKARIKSIMEHGKIHKEDDILRVQYFTHTLHVFEVEFLTQAKYWGQIPPLVEVSLSSCVPSITVISSKTGVHRT